MKFIAGLLIILGSIIASVIHLQQSASSYYDFVGFAMVLGGTIAVAVMIVPIFKKSNFKLFLNYLFRSPKRHESEVLDASVGLVSSAQLEVRPEPVALEGLPGKVINQGIELLSLGFSAEKIEIILTERIRHWQQEGFEISKGVKSLAKYPPAFGLAGTVLGLVHLMRGISGGMDPAETGGRMAIALVATFYGLLVANVLVNPVGEVIDRGLSEEVALGELALQGVLLAAEKTPTLEATELLNSYVGESDRVNVLSQFSMDEVA